MAQYNFFDYGKAVQDGQQIQSNRIKNQMAGMQLEESQNYIKAREEAKRIRQQFENMPAAIEEMEERGLFDEASKMRDAYISQKYNSVKLLSTLRDNVDATNYDQLRQDLIQAGAVEPDMMPPEYSDDWFRKQIKAEKNKLQTHTIKWGNQGATFSKDLMVDEYGNVRWEGDPYEDSADRNARQGSGKGFSMKAADTNSIRGATASLYGAMWDPVTGRYSGLNKDQEKEVAALNEEASRIYNANEGRVPHAEAVARAARRMNINVRDLRKDEQAGQRRRQGMVDFATQGADQMLNSNEMNDPFGLYR